MLDGGLAHLLGGRGCEDRAGSSGSQQALTDQAWEGRFMAGTATGDDGHFGWRGGVWPAEDNLVLPVQGQGRVCDCQRTQCSVHQVVGVVEEVFCCARAMLELGYPGRWIQ